MWNVWKNIFTIPLLILELAIISLILDVISIISKVLFVSKLISIFSISIIKILYRNQYLKIKKQIKPVKFYRLEKLRKIHNLNKITCNILHKCKCFRR